MTLSVTLDVAIGLALVFLIFSVAVSKINEFVTSVLNIRGAQLESAIAMLVDDSPTAGPLTNTLMDGAWSNLRVARSTLKPPAAFTEIPPPPPTRKERVLRARTLSLPSYISGESFAKGIIDLLGVPGQVELHRIDPTKLGGPGPAAYAAAQANLTPATAHALLTSLPPDDPQEDKVTALVAAAQANVVSVAASAVDSLPANAPLRGKLTDLVTEVGEDQNKIRQGLITWYDDAMDRLSGAYKRRVQKFLIGYALILTLAFNVDAVSMASALWRNEPARTLAVAEAQQTLSAGPTTVDGTPSSAAQNAETDLRSAQSLDLPLGWSTSKASQASKRRLLPSLGQVPLKLLGWAITVVALTFGAPFWFDALGKLVNMRGSGPKPTTTTT